MFLHSGSTLKLMGFHIVMGFQPARRKSGNRNKRVYVCVRPNNDAPKASTSCVELTRHRVAGAGVTGEVKFLSLLSKTLRKIITKA
jgi:hypothetical protein